MRKVLFILFLALPAWAGVSPWDLEDWLKVNPAVHGESVLSAYEELWRLADQLNLTSGGDETEFNAKKETFIRKNLMPFVESLNSEETESLLNHIEKQPSGIYRNHFSLQNVDMAFRNELEIQWVSQTWGGVNAEKMWKLNRVKKLLSDLAWLEEENQKDLQTRLGWTMPNKKLVTTHNQILRYLKTETNVRRLLFEPGEERLRAEYQSLSEIIHRIDVLRNERVYVKSEDQKVAEKIATMAVFSEFMPAALLISTGVNLTEGNYFGAAVSAIPMASRLKPLGAIGRFISIAMKKGIRFGTVIDTGWNQTGASQLVHEGLNDAMKKARIPAAVSEPVVYAIAVAPTVYVGYKTGGKIALQSGVGVWRGRLIGSAITPLSMGAISGVTYFGENHLGHSQIDLTWDGYWKEAATQAVSSSLYSGALMKMGATHSGRMLGLYSQGVDFGRGLDPVLFSLQTGNVAQGGTRFLSNVINLADPSAALYGLAGMRALPSETKNTASPERPVERLKSVEKNLIEKDLPDLDPEIEPTRIRRASRKPPESSRGRLRPTSRRIYDQKVRNFEKQLIQNGWTFNEGRVVVGFDASGKFKVADNISKASRDELRSEGFAKIYQAKRFQKNGGEKYLIRRYPTAKGDLPVLLLGAGEQKVGFLLPDGNVYLEATHSALNGNPSINLKHTAVMQKVLERVFTDKELWKNRRRSFKVEFPEVIEAKEDWAIVESRANENNFGYMLDPSRVAQIPEGMGSIILEYWRVAKELGLVVWDAKPEDFMYGNNKTLYPLDLDSYFILKGSPAHKFLLKVTKEVGVNPAEMEHVITENGGDQGSFFDNTLTSLLQRVHNRKYVATHHVFFSENDPFGPRRELFESALHKSSLDLMRDFLDNLIVPRTHGNPGLEKIVFRTLWYPKIKVMGEPIESILKRQLDNSPNPQQLADLLIDFSEFIHKTKQGDQLSVNRSVTYIPPKDRAFNGEIPTRLTDLSKSQEMEIVSPASPLKSTFDSTEPAMWLLQKEDEFFLATLKRDGSGYELKPFPPVESLSPPEQIAAMFYKHLGVVDPRLELFNSKVRPQLRTIFEITEGNHETYSTFIDHFLSVISNRLTSSEVDEVWNLLEKVGEKGVRNLAQIQSAYDLGFTLSEIVRQRRTVEFLKVVEYQTGRSDFIRWYIGEPPKPGYHLTQILPRPLQVWFNTVKNQFVRSNDHPTHFGPPLGWAKGVAVYDGLPTQPGAAADHFYLIFLNYSLNQQVRDFEAAYRATQEQLGISFLRVKLAEISKAEKNGEHWDQGRYGFLKPGEIKATVDVNGNVEIKPGVVPSEFEKKDLTNFAESKNFIALRRNIRDLFGDENGMLYFALDGSGWRVVR